MKIIQDLTMTVRPDELAEGYFVVSTACRMKDTGWQHPAFYRRLTWTEAVDVLLVTFDELRPGTDIELEGQQLGLW